MSAPQVAPAARKSGGGFPIWLLIVGVLVLLCVAAVIGVILLGGLPGR
jgi:hypothetical protein